MALYFRRCFRNSTGRDEWKIVELNDEGERESRKKALEETTMALAKIKTDFPEFTPEEQRMLLEKITRNYYFIADNLVDQQLFKGLSNFIAIK